MLYFAFSRWDLQRLREQRLYDKLQQGRKAEAQLQRGEDEQNELLSFLPEADNGRSETIVTQQTNYKWRSSLVLLSQPGSYTRVIALKVRVQDLSTRAPCRARDLRIMGVYGCMYQGAHQKAGSTHGYRYNSLDGLLML